MTEKQFKMINTNLTDENGRIYYNIQRADGFNICQVYGKNNAKSLINELNELAEENNELKEKNEFVGLLANHRGEMVSFANALIQDLDDEVSQDMWERFKDEMYNEWKQKRGIE